MHLDSVSPFVPLPLLTPRQNRLEGAIVRALLARGTRSELRGAVHQLVDLFRLQGIALEEGVEHIRAVAMRATMMMADTSTSVGDTPAERVASIVQWARQRYGRCD